MQNVRSEHGTWNSQSGKPRDGKLIRPGGRSSGYGYVGAHQGLPSALRRQQKGPAGASLLSLSGGAAGRSFPWKPVALVAVLAVAVVALLVHGCASKQQDAAEPEVASELAVTDSMQDEVQEARFELASLDFEDIPADDGLQTFSLAGGDAPQLSVEVASGLQGAVADVASWAELGFVMVDADSGNGIAYNLDAVIYGASSVKAPFATFVCEQLIDTGLLSLDDQCPAGMLIDYESSFAAAGASSYAVRDLLEASLTQSDNNAFLFLRDAYTDLGWDNWLLSFGADKMEISEDYPFSWFTPRDLAEAWAETYNYLQEGTEASELLSEWLGSTATSFLRESLASTGAVVKSKAGWVEAGWSGSGSLCDAGIIELDGKTYLMSVMTSLGDSASARESLEDLIAAVFAVRADLEP